ncbi:MAG: sensor histidine kinase [Prolixibacteraceae bacterium]
MKSKTLKYIILLATISVAGVLLIQFIFLKNSYTYSETQFRESAAVALKEVAWQMMQATGNTANFDSIAPVEMHSNTCYLVNVEEPIDYDLLKFHLAEELKKHEIYADFEFAVFDPATSQMTHSTLVTNEQEETVSTFNFPTSDKYDTYFGVHFTNRSAYFHSRLSVWYLFTALLVVVVVFFGYTLSVIIRQRQLSEIQKSFINNLTHELKTPISSIALSASVIDNESILNSPDRLFKYTKIIKEQNTRLSENVEKVLNLASLEKNKIRLNLEPVKPDDFVNENIQHFKKSDFGRKAKIYYQPKISGIVIKADKFHFSNLLQNILENAVKYCDKRPEISIVLKKNRNQLFLSFADNGIGIPKEHREKIFKKFYRVPTGNVHNVKGFGLGLDYVAKIVKAHGWKIKVDENPAGGSIFTLIIPMQK